jgi:hypothetical protein
VEAATATSTISMNTSEKSGTLSSRPVTSVLRSNTMKGKRALKFEMRFEARSA